MRLGRPVSGSCVARNASSSSRRVELLVGPLALSLEALADPQQAELEAQLKHVQRLRERLVARRSSSAAHSRSTSAITLRHHRLRRVTSCSDAARCAASSPKIVERCAARVERDLEAVAGDPARDGDRRGRCRSLRSCSAPAPRRPARRRTSARRSPRSTSSAAREQRLAQPAQLVGDLSSRRLRRLHLLVVGLEVAQRIAHVVVYRPLGGHL